MRTILALLVIAAVGCGGSERVPTDPASEGERTLTIGRTPDPACGYTVGDPLGQWKTLGWAYQWQVSDNGTIFAFGFCSDLPTCAAHAAAACDQWLWWKAPGR